jgi:hypothetical protein
MISHTKERIICRNSKQNCLGLTKVKWELHDVTRNFMVYSLICIAKLRRLEWVKYATIRKIRNKCIIKFDGGRDNVSRKG